jgi:hypothetical protein
MQSVQIHAESVQVCADLCGICVVRALCSPCGSAQNLCTEYMGECKVLLRMKSGSAFFDGPATAEVSADISATSRWG